jgi:hypothetical protein
MKKLPVLLIFAAIMFVYSCENFDWFRSESTMKKQVQGTWVRDFLTDTAAVELWTFKDGKLQVLRNLIGYHCDTPYPCDFGNTDLNKTDGNDTIVLDSGSYSVDAKLTVSYLKTSDLKAIGENNYNYKWTIVQIDNKILELAADGAERTGGAGVIQREFVKE